METESVQPKLCITFSLFLLLILLFNLAIGQRKRDWSCQRFIDYIKLLTVLFGIIALRRELLSQKQRQNY